MIAMVLTFAVITMVFEAIILFKFVSAETLKKGWVQGLIHSVAFALNLAIHFGTIVGTMTAVTAALASFATVPLVLYIKCFMKNWNMRRTA